MLKALLKNIMLYVHNHQKRKIPIEYIFPILIRFFLIIYITEKFVSLLIFIFKNIQMILILIVKYFFLEVRNLVFLLFWLLLLKK